MEANMDGIEANMDGLKDGMEAKIDGLKVDMEGLTKLLQERLPGGDKVIHENHDEDKRNMNYDFRNSNFGFKNHHIPNIDMKKFDDKDLVTWIVQMEQYFDIRDVQHSQKIHILTLYL